MQLQIPKEKRLLYIKSVIPKLKLEFPQRAIAKETGYDEGNISSFLSGSKRISGPFFTKFVQAFPVQPDEGWDKEPQQASDSLKPGKKEITVQDHIDEILQQKYFLQDLIKSNLTEISILQKEHYAYLLAAMQRAAERFANDKTEVVDDELSKIDKYAADHLIEIGQKGKASPVKG